MVFTSLADPVLGLGTSYVAGTRGNVYGTLNSVIDTVNGLGYTYSYTDPIVDPYVPPSGSTLTFTYLSPTWYCKSGGLSGPFTDTNSTITGYEGFASDRAPYDGSRVVPYAFLHAHQYLPELWINHSGTRTTPTISDYGTLPLLLSSDMGSGGCLVATDASATPAKVVKGDTYAAFGGSSTQSVTVDCTVFGAIQTETLMARHIPSCIHDVSGDLIASINDIEIVDLVPKADSYIHSNYNALGGNSLSTYRYMTTTPLAASCLYDMVKYVDSRLNSFQTATQIQGLEEALIQATGQAVLSFLWNRLFGTLSGAALQAAITAAGVTANAAMDAATLAGIAAANAAAVAADTAAKLVGDAFEGLLKKAFDDMPDADKAGLKGPAGNDGADGAQGPKGDPGSAVGWYYIFNQLFNEGTCSKIDLYTSSNLTIHNSDTSYFSGSSWIFDLFRNPDPKLVVQGKISCTHLQVLSGIIGVPSSGVRFVTGDPIDQFVIDTNGDVWSSGKIFAGNGLYVEMKVPPSLTLSATSPTYTHGVDVFTFESMQNGPVTTSGLNIYSTTTSSTNHGGYDMFGAYIGNVPTTSGTSGDWEGVTCSTPFVLDGWTIKFDGFAGFALTSTFGSNDGGTTWTLVDVFDASDPSETGLHGGKTTNVTLGSGTFSTTREFSNTTEYSKYRVVFHTIVPAYTTFRILGIQWLCILDPLALTTTVVTTPPSTYTTTNVTYITGPVSSGNNTVNGDLTVSGNAIVSGTLASPIFNCGSIFVTEYVQTPFLTGGCLSNSLTSTSTVIGASSNAVRLALSACVSAPGDFTVAGALTAASLTGGCISGSFTSTSTTTAASSAAVRTLTNLISTTYDAIPVLSDLTNLVSSTTGASSTAVNNVKSQCVSAPGAFTVTGVLTAASLSGCISDATNVTSSIIAASSTAVKNSATKCVSAPGAFTVTGALNAASATVTGALSCGALTATSLAGCINDSLTLTSSTTAASSTAAKALNTAILALQAPNKYLYSAGLAFLSFPVGSSQCIWSYASVAATVVNDHWIMNPTITTFPSNGMIPVNVAGVYFISIHILFGTLAATTTTTNVSVQVYNSAGTISKFLHTSGSSEGVMQGTTTLRATTLNFQTSLNALDAVGVFLNTNMTTPLPINEYRLSIALLGS